MRNGTEQNAPKKKTKREGSKNRLNRVREKENRIKNYTLKQYKEYKNTWNVG